MANIYEGGAYLNSNPTWHEEDSPWKAGEIARMIEHNGLDPALVAEIGCGAGGILAALRTRLAPHVEYSGYEIAPQAYAIARQKSAERLDFHNENMLEQDRTFDLLLVIDVLEHIPNYHAFASACRQKARYKIYHIPLEVNVQSVLRASFAFTLDSGRNEVGHLHFFTAEYALMALQETGHKVIDTALTDGGIALAGLHPSLRRTLANIPRRLVSLVSRKWAARLFGGYSLLVLCE